MNTQLEQNFTMLCSGLQTSLTDRIPGSAQHHPGDWFWWFPAPISTHKADEPKQGGRAIGNSINPSSRTADLYY